MTESFLRAISMSRDDIILKEKVCRTCLSCTAVLHPLFPDPDKMFNFMNGTGLRININDGLPQNICVECSKTIENSMKFRIKCQETEKELLKYFNYTCNKTNLTKFEFNTESDTLEIKENGTDNIFQNIFKAETEDKTSELLLEDGHIITSEDEYLLDVKNDSITRLKNYSPVESKIFSKEIESYDRKRYYELIEGPIVPKQPVKCKICKKYSKCLNSFEKHAMSHLGYNILCEFCAKLCISRANLVRHQQRKHGLARDNSFPCFACKFQAMDREQLEVHERKVHTKERPFVCKNCGAAFFSKRVLIQHEAVHKTDQPYQCDICPMKFKLKCHLTKHVHRVHTKNYLRYTYGCYICPKKYSRTHHVRKHLVKIHGVPIKQQEPIRRFDLKNFNTSSSREQDLLNTS